MANNIYFPEIETIINSDQVTTVQQLHNPREAIRVSFTSGKYITIDGISVHQYNQRTQEGE